MTHSFHPEAEVELFEAIEYYENRETGLGLDFSIEVCSALQRIVDHPTAWPVLEGDIRRCMTNRFPYGVLYSVEPREIYILAIMHLHRDPDYWEHRRPGG